MVQRRCRNCGIVANYSAVVLLSTLGCAPRRQKTTKSVALCSGCTRAWAAATVTVVGNIILDAEEALTMPQAVLTSESEKCTKGGTAFQSLALGESRTRSGIETEMACESTQQSRRESQLMFPDAQHDPASSP
jgi:hypothetical protein